MEPAFTPRQGEYLAFIYWYTKLNRVAPAEADFVRYFAVTPPAVHLMILKRSAAGSPAHPAKRAPSSSRCPANGFRTSNRQTGREMSIGEPMQSDFFKLKGVPPRIQALEIAALVLARYPGAATPWRMTPADYLDALRTEGRALEPGAVDRAARTFPALAAEIAARGHAAHQEGLIPALTRDLSRFVLEGVAPPVGYDPPGEQVAAMIADRK
jgi:hypothetical protein